MKKHYETGKGAHMTDQTSTKSRVDRSTFMPLLFTMLNLFLYTPFLLYKDNVDSFGLSFATILTYLAIPFSLLILVLFVVLKVLPQKQYEQAVSLLFVVGLLLWLQGNVLVWKYGLFNGQSIDWNAGVWRGWLDAAVWLAMLMAALICYKRLYGIAAYASSVFIILQTALLFYYSFAQPDVWTKRSNKFYPPPGIFEFSKTQNVIHIILDGFQADIFKKVIECDPQFQEALEGFTFFSNTTGSFPTTYMSVPVSLSGRVYKNDVPMKQFINSVFDGPTEISALQRKGYETDFVPLGPYSPPNINNHYSVSELYGVSERQYGLFSAAYMLDLVLFRDAPHFIKKAVYNDQMWLLRNMVLDSSAPRFQSLADRNFMRDFLAKMSVSRQKPVFKFIHLATSHQPLVMNSKGDYTGKVLETNLANYLSQDSFALSQVTELIRKLKESGIYDNSLIILQADHGAGLPVDLKKQPPITDIESVIGSAWALLAIKPPHSKGILRTSDAEVMLSDIPATVSSLLHLPDAFEGRSAFDVKPGEARERKYYHYLWEHDNWQAAYFKRLTEYTIKGNVSDGASWQLTSATPSPQLSFKATRIEFGTASGAPFLRTGWSDNEASSAEGKRFNWATGKVASLFLSLPKNEIVRLKANVKYAHLNAPQNVTVKVDGEVVGHWKLTTDSQWKDQQVLVPPDKNRRDVSIVEFFFSETAAATNHEPRPLSLLFSSLAVEKVNNTRITFGTADASQFLRSGWGSNETLPSDGSNFNWALGKSASIAVPLLKHKEASLTATVQFPQFATPQRVTVLVDGVVAGHWVVANTGKWENHKIVIKPRPGGPEVSTITFNFSQTSKPTANDSRALALLFNRIDIDY